MVCLGSTCCLCRRARDVRQGFRPRPGDAWKTLDRNTRKGRGGR
jgi:hypothetical protein